MIPEQLTNITQLEETQYASKTYRLDLTSKRIGGLVDNSEAVSQAINKIFSTERYSSVIYDGDYGIEVSSLVGKDFDYVISELQRRIPEALLVDDRVLEVTDFEYTKDNDILNVSVTITTIYGIMQLSTEVQL